jgi:hypothetical protein
MKEFLLTVFLCTFIVYFVLAVLYGKMLYRPFIGYGPVYQINGLAARLFSAFCAIFLIACAYFGIPRNIIILNSAVYSNLVSILIGAVLGSIIFFRSLKFDSSNFNDQNALFFKSHYIIAIVGIIAFYVLLVLWKLFQDGYFKN